MKLDVTLISGRTIDQGVSCDAKTSHAYFNAASCCELSPASIAKIGTKAGSNVLVTTDYGRVVVRVKENDGNPDNIAFIPMGPWANALVNPDTAGCGMPGFKGIKAVIEPSDENVPVMKELMDRLKV